MAHGDLNRHTQRMKNRYGHALRRLRTSLGISQRALAKRLNVCQQTLSHWECGRRPLPAERGALAERALCCARGTLTGLPEEGGFRLLVRSSSAKRARYRPPYVIRARIADLEGLGSVARQVAQLAQERCSTSELEETDERLPRDTAHELVFAMHLLAAGARVAYSCYSAFRLPVNTLCDDSWTDGHDLLQPVVVWTSGDERMVVFGQAWLNIAWCVPVRTDFLVYYKRKGQAGYWLYVEIDDASHKDKLYHDQARALAIALPGLRYENYVVTRPGFFDRFVRDVRALQPKALEMRRARRRQANERRKRRLAESVKTQRTV